MTPREVEAAVFAAVNARFGGHRVAEGDEARSMTLEGVEYCVFDNGQPKAEGREVFPKLTMPREAMAELIADSVARIFPAHADQVVVWRIKPQLEAENSRGLKTVAPAAPREGLRERVYMRLAAV